MCLGGKFNKHVNHLYAGWNALKIEGSASEEEGKKKWSSRKIFYVQPYFRFASTVLRVHRPIAKAKIHRRNQNWKTFSLSLPEPTKRTKHSYFSFPKSLFCGEKFSVWNSIYQMFIYDRHVHIRDGKRKKQKKSGGKRGEGKNMYKFTVCWNDIKYIYVSHIVYNITNWYRLFEIHVCWNGNRAGMTSRPGPIRTFSMLIALESIHLSQFAYDPSSERTSTGTRLSSTVYLMPKRGKMLHSRFKRGRNFRRLKEELCEKEKTFFSLALYVHFHCHT